MNKIELTIVKDKVRVVSPYNARFVSKARNFRGLWKGGAWFFDDSIIEHVRELMIECFGTTGEEPYEECDLHVSEFSSSKERGPVSLFGRTMAYAFGRDSGAKLGDDIILLSGRCYSGGSFKNWRTIVDEATFIIRKFPVPSLDIPEVKEAINSGWCTVKYPDRKRTIKEIESDISKYKSILENLERELSDAKLSEGPAA